MHIATFQPNRNVISALNSPRLEQEMETNNIYELSRDRPLKSAEIYQPNDFYGHATILKRYVNLQENYQIKAAIEHGAGIGGKIWNQDIKNPLPAIFTSSFHRSNILKTFTKKKIFVIGPKIKYAKHYLNKDELEIKKRKLGKNLLSFPAHSTHHVNTNYDIQKYCQVLRNLGKNYESVRVCLYWKDILRGLDKEYQRNGFEVLTAGHMFDPLFLPRLKSIIETATVTTSNIIGTILGYCVILNKPHLLMESEVKNESKEIDKLLECSELTDQPDVQEIREAFVELQEKITPKQNEIVNKYWGNNEFKTNAEMQAIINECEALFKKGTRVYVSKHEQKNREYLFEGNFDEVLLNVGQLTKTYPRRKTGKLKLNHREIIFTDLHSFYHQAIQIFKSQIYGFSADRDNPIIIDCGAHIGLASIYFAEKYPKGKIYAYEADPNIAKTLNENLISLGLKNIETFSKAVWINDSGVLFKRTNDDSGFVSNSESESCLKIPSIRLKNILKDKEIDLLKLDIEGAEFEVIKDCGEVLTNVKNIIIEVHKFREHNGSLADILNILEKNSFEYTFGDFHSADWIEPSLIPPFSFCKTDKYTMTIFAWQPENRKFNEVETHKYIEKAINELNFGQNDNAIHLIKNAIQEAPKEKALYYALAVAYAREDNFSKAKEMLAQIPENNHIYGKAFYLLETINNELKNRHRGE